MENKRFRYTAGLTVQDGSLIIGGLSEKEHENYNGTGGLVICDMAPDTEYTTAPEEHTQGNTQIINEAFAVMRKLGVTPEKLLSMLADLTTASRSLLSIVRTLEMEGAIINRLMSVEHGNLLSAYKLQTEKALNAVPSRLQPFGYKDRDEHLHILKITERQKWFLMVATEAKDAILPLHPNTLDADVFEQDYGISKEEVNEEIADLREQIKQSF